MSRDPSLWFRKFNKCWYSTIHGKQTNLGEDKKAAKEKLRQLLSDYSSKRPVKVFKGNVWELLDSFLDDAKQNTADATYNWYRMRLQYFKDGVEDMPVKKLKRYHVTEWLNGKPDWSPTYKAGIVTAIKRAFSWAADEERIEVNPLRSLKKPAAEHREVKLSAEDFAKVLAEIKYAPFRDIICFVFLTGIRPQEARAIKNEWIRHEEKIIVFPVLKSKGKKRARIIHLTDEAYVILKRWAEKYPEGPVFRNRLKQPWKANAFACRFKRLEGKIGFRVRMYDLRHAYAHDGLTKGGISPEVMATLLGHQDTRMLMQVYGGLLNAPEYMREQATKARASVPVLSIEGASK
jgi:integrase